MSDPKKSGRSGQTRIARAVLFGASLSTIAVAGATAGARAQTSAEEACAFAMRLRSAYTVERVLSDFPNDRCVPLMLGALRPSLLSQISRELVLSLPASQLRLIPQDVLDQVGRAAPSGQRRSVTPSYEPQY